MTPDSTQHSWTHRAPQAIQPYLRLARFDRPVGAWLLYWPCVWGLLLAAPSLGWQQIWYGLLLGIGSIAMRSAGCVWNDILDRDLDAQVERTRGRPLPAGDVTVARAACFMLLLCALGLAVLLLLPRLAQIMALCAIPLVALYPLMKRITWWPQAWLGLTFNWGVLVGYATMRPHIDAAALALYAGGLLWTLGYDTIYALQDMEDDALAGVKSSARRLGRSVVRAVLLFYFASLLFVATALWLAGGGFWALAALGFGGQLLWQWTALRRAGSAPPPELALRLFRSNSMAGALLAAGMAILRGLQG